MTCIGKRPGIRRARALVIGAGVALLSILSAASVVVAAEPTGTTASAPVVADNPEATSQSVEGLGVAIGTADLGALRGGDDVQSQTILVDGTVTDNSAENVVSGHNVISDGSFGNAAGIATVIQNSGSNVLIQNAMNVNIDFVDPAP